MLIRNELQNLMNTYAAAYRACDAAACAAMFSLNGELHSPYAPAARGRAAIEALHHIWTQDGGSNKLLTVVDAGSSGELAWCLVTFSEGQVTRDGTSLNILKREAGGDWLIRICRLNSDVPQTDS